MKMRYLFLIGAFALAGCQQDNFREEFAGGVERAHRADLWRTHEAVQADITVTLDNQAVVDGTMLFTTDGAKARLDQPTGGSVIFNGLRAWVTPANATIQQGRYHARVWPFLLSLPMRLQDKGTDLTDIGLRKLGGRSYYAARLTFDSSASDSPDDWYILYADLKTHRLAAVAHIVTYGRSLEVAQREPRALVYEDFRDIEGVILPTRWRYYDWNEREGIYGEPIGEAILNDVRFVTPTPETFARPVDARLDTVPSKE